MNVKAIITRSLVSSIICFMVGCGGSSGGTRTPTNNITLTEDPSGIAVEPGSIQPDPVVTVQPDPIPPTPVAQPAWGSIENLFGRVTLNYRFEDDGYRGNDYSISFNFDASSELEPTLGFRTIGAKRARLNGAGEALVCAEYFIWDFYCVYVDAISPEVFFTEMFVISMDSQFRGTGNYENCLFSTIEGCGNDVELSPDGTVDLTISRGTQMANSLPTINGMNTTLAEARDFKMASTMQQSKGVNHSEVSADYSLATEMALDLLSRL